MNELEEIRMYLQNYDKCQRMDYNFTKSNAKLHSVTIQPEVWRQVSFKCKMLTLIMHNIRTSI